MSEEPFKAFSEYQAKYKHLEHHPDPKLSFDNPSLLKYEVFRGELEVQRKPPNESTTKKCAFLIKRIIVHDKDQFQDLKNFIVQVFEFQKAVRVPAFLKLVEASKNDNTLYLVQKDHKKTLAENEKKFVSTEIEVLSILRSITKFYYQMKQEDIFEAFVNFSFPLRHLNQDLIYAFEKKNKDFPDAEDDQRIIIKVDMLAFERVDKNQKVPEKVDKTTFHLAELKGIVRRYLDKNRLKHCGTCSQNLLRKIGIEDVSKGENIIKWREILTHPLFKADYEINPNFDFWKIEVADGRLIENKKKETLETSAKIVNGNGGNGGNKGGVEEQKNQGPKTILNSTIPVEKGAKPEEKEKEKKKNLSSSSGGGLLSGCFKSKKN